MINVKSIYLLFLLGVVGCSLIELLEPEFYAGCCAQSAIADTLGEATIFIPNAITPNDDGLNDAFSIYTSRPLHIKSLTVTEQNNVLAISRADIAVEGWTDIWVPKNVSGIAIHGLYDYVLTLVADNGAELTLSGQFCALSCVGKDAETIPFDSCQFSTQTDKFGTYLDSLPSLEPCE